MFQVKTLCEGKRILPPDDFVVANSFHYGKYDGAELVSYLSLCVVSLNRTPGAMGISVDIAVSSCVNHSMTIAIDSLKALLRRRRNKSYLFAQVAKTPTARQFWSGKLNRTTRASIVPALLHMFDNRYIIYADAEDMVMFFE